MESSNPPFPSTSRVWSHWNSCPQGLPGADGAPQTVADGAPAGSSTPEASSEPLLEELERLQQALDRETQDDGVLSNTGVAQLFVADQRLKLEVGDEAHDAILYATGRDNRLVSATRGKSPSDRAAAETFRPLAVSQRHFVGPKRRPEAGAARAARARVAKARAPGGWLGFRTRRVRAGAVRALARDTPQLARVMHLAIHAAECLPTDERAARTSY